MYEKGKDLASAFVARRVGRRELLRRMGQLGLTAAASKFLLNQASTAALAADFDWKKHKGTTLKLLLNKHPYADAMIANLENFKTLTGMDVTYDVFPEDVYFDKVTAALSSGSSRIRRLHDRRLHDLDLWSGRLDRRPQRVHQGPGEDQPELQLGRLLPGLRASTAWNGRARRRARLRRRQAMVHPLGLRAEQPLLQPGDVRQGGRRSRRRTSTNWSPARPSSPRTSAGRLRHRRARLALLGDDPSGLPVRLTPISAQSDLNVDRRQAVGRDEHGRIQGVPRRVGADDPGERARRTGRPIPGTRSAPISAPAPRP